MSEALGHPFLNSARKLHSSGTLVFRTVRVFVSTGMVDFCREQAVEKVFFV